jgi:hypothetical protein
MDEIIMVWQTNHGLRMELIDAILNDSTDDSSVAELTPYARVEHPILVSVEHPILVNVKKKNQLALSPSRRSKRLSPRRRMRPKKYSE